MNWFLYLDDERFPKTEGPWIIARSVEEAFRLIQEKGCPQKMSLDHDLGWDDALNKALPDGTNFVHQFVAKCLDGEIKLPEDFSYNIHSANPVGSANMKSYLDSFFKMRT